MKGHRQGPGALQTAALASLPQRSIFIALYNRTDPPTPNDYHWALYIHMDSVRGGPKYHVRNLGAGWMADHAITAGIFKENFLVGLVRIGRVEEEEIGCVDYAFRTFDAELNEIKGLTCRTWALDVIGFLMGGKAACPSARLIVEVKSIESLQTDLFDWANSIAADYSQPRPWVDSNVCNFSREE